MVIKHIKGRDNGRADAISRRPDLIRDKTEVVEDPPIIKTDDQGNLIPAEVLIGILFNIMENPIKMEDFKKVYLEDPRLEDQGDDLYFQKDDQGIIQYNGRIYIPTKYRLDTIRREYKLPISGGY